MPDSETTIESALDNLAAIKQGNDPRGDREDALSVAIDEVDTLFEAHDLGEYVDRDHVTVAIARWKGKNGCAMYERKLTDRRYGQRIPKRQSEHRTGHHSVVVNERIFDEGRVDEFIDTVRHEVAHVVAYADPACGPHGSSPGHDRRWKRWAHRLGAEPTSCASKKHNDYAYWYGCPNGCWEAGRLRRSKKVTSPGRYYCGQCGETCSSWKDGESRPTEPGVSV